MNVTVRNPEIVKLEAEIDSFRVEFKLSRSAFGVLALKDPNLIPNIEAGRELRWDTIVAIRAKMADHSKTAQK